mmetsp:Transcript_53265/g.137503  ORF Transcript_53265/g.137503 Transcript_53265/m.137503 type:complete len:202 (-) Transcript_53265:673-1278(-)
MVASGENFCASAVSLMRSTRMRATRLSLLPGKRKGQLQINVGATFMTGMAFPGSDCTVATCFGMKSVIMTLGPKKTGRMTISRVRFSRRSLNSSRTVRARWPCSSPGSMRSLKRALAAITEEAPSPTFSASAAATARRFSVDSARSEPLSTSTTTGAFVTRVKGAIAMRWRPASTVDGSAASAFRRCWRCSSTICARSPSR